MNLIRQKMTSRRNSEDSGLLVAGYPLLTNRKDSQDRCLSLEGLAAHVRGFRY
jgi:hypothetical protein